MTLTTMQAATLVSPLTVIVRGALERWLAPSILAELSRQVRTPNYERKVTLQALMAVMLDAVVGMQPSVHAAAVARRDQWQGSVQALYSKLSRVDPAFSMSLVRQTADGIRDQLDAGMPRRQKPRACVKILDGTMPDGSEHRLGVLRQLRAAGLPANAVVIYDNDSGLCDRVAVSEDAYCSERPLAETLLKEAVAGEIYVGDRGFCTCRLIGQVVDRHANFIFREHAANIVYDQETREKPCGRCDTGRVLEGQVRLCDQTQDRKWVLRRIRLHLDHPTQAGEEDIWLLTNLPSTWKPRKIAEIYRDRWKIERHFHRIKHELHGQMPTLGEPRAAIFALCVSLAAGNVLALINKLSPSAGSASKPVKPKLSAYYVALEIGHSYAAIETLTTDKDWKTIAALSPAAFWRWAKGLAQRVPWSHYTTHPRGPKQRPPPHASGKHRHHYSTFRLLQEQRRKHKSAC